MTNLSGKTSNGVKTILLIHGPNLNALGRRDQKHYGTLTLPDLVQYATRAAKKLGITLKAFQSNHEGALIDFIQKNSSRANGILINAGALSHYSYALHDAIVDAHIPAMEVHLSNVAKREAWRKKSVIAPACAGVVSGKKEQGYAEALMKLSALMRTP